MRLLTDQELFELKGSEVVLDIEVYPNYFLICFYFDHIKAGVYMDNTCFNRKRLRWLLGLMTTVTFNGNHYDIPVLMYALLNDTVTCASLYELSTRIVLFDEKSWNIYKDLGQKSVDNVKIDHIDLKEVAFGQSSLKTYAGRIHAPYMQDLPYDPEESLDAEQKTNVYTYCWNDCLNTALLRIRLSKELKLRKEMGIAYSADLRSKSDAQIAEVVISRELKWKHGVEARVPRYKIGHSFKYKVPDYVSFKSPVLQEALEVIRNVDFVISENNTVKLPQEIKDLYIKLNHSRYTIGIGGLHSNEKCQTLEADDKYMLVDRDVASYYPAIILNQKLFPKHLTRAFLDIYKGIVDKRLAAKASGDKTTADSLKITINGSFGKFGSPYSILYGPELLIQTTMSGQLSLLMLIDMLEDAGFDVMSANTDGVVTKIERTRKDEFNRICGRWEEITNFVTEETEYLKLCSRDVNSYIACVTVCRKTERITIVL